MSGDMASDAQLTKRDRYLVEGKIKVMEANSTEATVFAHGSEEEPYVVRFRANTWSCTCPAQKPDCVHVLAALQVSPLRSREGAPTGIGADPELDALLGPALISVDSELTMDELLSDDPIPVNDDEGIY